MLNLLLKDISKRTEQMLLLLFSSLEMHGMCVLATKMSDLFIYPFGLVCSVLFYMPLSSYFGSILYSF